MSGVYDNPKYYEIAFSFRDIPAEVNVFEECFRRFSHIPVKSVLELGCGNSPHMEELAKRGYEYNGLDMSEAMLEYSREKAKLLGGRINLIRGNMVDFALDTSVDFALVMLGSLFTTSTNELISHFESVARALKAGGLYFLDWCVQFEPPWESQGKSSWELERDGIRVKTTASWEAVSLARQTFREKIVLDIDDHGEKFTIEGIDIRRAIYPQEFLRFIDDCKDFEFVGWWNKWDLNQPLEHAIRIDRPICIIRRK